EGYIKLQPLISEIEADLVIRALEQMFHGHSGQSLSGKGRSYLGRFYLRAKLDGQMVRKLADEFTSIQSIHPPIFAFSDSVPPDVTTHGASPSSAPPPNPNLLPC